jgi:hypothetical protein
MIYFLDRAGKPFFAQEQGDSVVGAPGLRRAQPSRRVPDRPASFCGKPIGPPAGILFPPMLFAQNPAKGGTPGPQARFSAEEKGIKVKRGKLLPYR